MAKRDDNPHRLNLVIPQALLEELRTVAKERFGAKDNHLTGQPEISQTLLKLIRIGIDTVINEDRYDESLEDRPETLQDLFNGLATELDRLKERVKELEQSLQTHIHTGKQLEVAETSSTQPLQIPVQIDIHTGNKDEDSLSVTIQQPVHIPEQIEVIQPDDTQQESLQIPEQIDVQKDNSKQLGVHTQTHIEDVRSPQEISEPLEIETIPSEVSGASTDEAVIQIPVQPQNLEETQKEVFLTVTVQPPNTIEPQSADSQQTGVHIQTHIEDVPPPPETTETLETSSEISSGATTDENIVPTPIHISEQIEEQDRVIQTDIHTGEQIEVESPITELTFTMTQIEMAAHLKSFGYSGVSKSTLNNWKMEGKELLEEKLKAYPKYKEDGWYWNPDAGKKGLFERPKP